MKSSQLKYLAFYGGTIAFVLGLFAIVTTYGEAHLKTAQNIAGDYRLTLPITSPCGSNTPVTLILQQSGVYVAAALVNPALPHNQTAFKPMTLSGQWRNQQIDLAGQVPMQVLCANAQGQGAIAVKIEGAIASSSRAMTHQESAPQQQSSASSSLTGTLSLNSAPSPLVAQSQPGSKEKTK
jgi:hypothetical protein